MWRICLFGYSDPILTIFGYGGLLFLLAVMAYTIGAAPRGKMCSYIVSYIRKFWLSITKVSRISQFESVCWCVFCMITQKEIDLGTQNWNSL